MPERNSKDERKVNCELNKAVQAISNQHGQTLS